MRSDLLYKLLVTSKRSVQVLQVNLTATFTLCRDVGAHMLQQARNSSGKRGSIINVASLLSFQGGFTVPAYAASKGGVAQLTKALSNEWASRGISVNAIAPGYVATEMNTALMEDADRANSILARIPTGRWGTPEDFKVRSAFDTFDRFHWLHVLIAGYLLPASFCASSSLDECMRLLIVLNMAS